MEQISPDSVNLVPLGHIRQFPSSVISFSSQYGSDKGSYSTHQLIVNKPTVYPRYGDFCEACVLRYYGEWWSRAPSAPPAVGTQPSCFPEGYCAEDYLEVEYDQPVHLLRVRVYETFMPGCIVGIHAMAPASADDESTTWYQLWRSSGPTREPHVARIFEPELTRLPSRPVNRLRLEFNCSLAEYYTEIDTVEIIGSLPGLGEPALELSHQMQTMQIASEAESDEQSGVAASHVAAGWFGNWPSELLTRLLGYLDLSTLLRVSRTCRLLHQFSCDPLLYKSVSLRPYCLHLTDAALLSMTGRVSATRHLELSWCANIRPDVFCDFLLGTSDCLSTLRLASCDFLDDQCLNVIGLHCRSITDLDLSSCSKQITPAGFTSISTGLTRLRRLNLYRTTITWEPLSSLIHANPGLLHINLGACLNISDCGDRAALALGQACPDLRSLDFWRSRSLGCQGITALADGCPSLVELDLGWCPQVNSKSGCIVHLARQCLGLRKLFLTANRSLRDTDLQEIAKNCKELRQLDILGTNLVTLKTVIHVLQSCPKLEMFDVSFCSCIQRSSINDIRQSFPHCSIQMSFQDQAA